MEASPPEKFHPRYMEVPYPFLSSEVSEKPEHNNNKIAPAVFFLNHNTHQTMQVGDNRVLPFITMQQHLPFLSC